MSADEKSVETPILNFQSVEFQFHPQVEHQELYSKLDKRTRFRVSQLGTVIWHAVARHTGEELVLKEFSFAEPESFWRDLSNPAWEEEELPAIPSGAERHLSPKRAEAFDKLLNGQMREEVRRKGVSNHPSFLPQFSTYSFELEAMICQFAQLYGCRRLVQSSRWGAVQLPSSPSPRFILEMEPLEEWEAPPVNDVFSLLNELLEMMMAVSQLHGMLIPLRCYPPELVRNLKTARARKAAHPYHYDLAPDQFMIRRTFNGVYEERELVLIDFNSARMGATELSDFSWGMVPGKDYYQPPERRLELENRKSLPSFATNPACDLYSLLVISLFLLARRRSEQNEISEIPGWETLQGFYSWLGSKDEKEAFRQRLESLVPHPSQRVMLQPLLELISHTLIRDPQERMESLTQFSPLSWKGTSDWMLVPRAMDFIARRCNQRQFQVGWKQPKLTLQQHQQETSLHKWLVSEQCFFRGGAQEHGRVALPHYTLADIHFLQADGNQPFVQQGRVLTQHPGEVTVYACFGGCVDFVHPLRLCIEAVHEPEESVTSDDLQAAASPLWSDPSSFALESSPPREPASSPPVPQSTVMYDSKALAEQFQRGKPPVEETIPDPAELSARIQARQAQQKLVSAELYDMPSSPQLQSPPRAMTMEHSREEFLRAVPAAESYLSPPTEDVSLSEMVSLGLAVHSSPPSESYPPSVEADFAISQEAVSAYEVETLDDEEEAGNLRGSHAASRSHTAEHWRAEDIDSQATPVELPPMVREKPTEAMVVDEHTAFWRNLRWQGMQTEEREALEILIATAESEPASMQRLQTLVHLHSRVIALSWSQEEDTPYFVERVRRLVRLRAEVPQESPLYGLLLNNVSVLMYEAIHFKKDLPPSWERLLGYTPMEVMEEWLQQTDGQHVSDKMKEVREQLTETVFFCRKVEEFLRVNELESVS